MGSNRATNHYDRMFHYCCNPIVIAEMGSGADLTYKQGCPSDQAIEGWAKQQACATANSEMHANTHACTFKPPHLMHASCCGSLPRFTATKSTSSQADVPLMPFDLKTLWGKGRPVQPTQVKAVLDSGRVHRACGRMTSFQAKEPF
eukprot:scaffold55021_cov21-Tisochrysis_lutea.AAC.1